MTDQNTPMVPETRAGFVDRMVRWGVLAAVLASLLISPRPAALLVRRVFAAGGEQVKQSLNRHAPADVHVVVNERHGDEDDALLDVAYPASVTGRLPLVLWVHGGGWVGGSKNELVGWVKLIAHGGFVVAAANYARAPEHRYPTPPRQMMQALQHMQGDADRFHIDPDRIVIAGDSAGAQIAAQLAAMVTTPGYADTIGVTPTVTPAQLRGLVLACGPYDRALFRQAGTPAGRRFIEAVLWAYSGQRNFDDDPVFSTWSVTDHLSPAFPPALLTVGNADPLRPHTELLAD
jgi:acetyl esterase/lipase